MAYQETEYALFSGPGLPGNSESGGALAAGVPHGYRHTGPGPISAKDEIKLSRTGKYMVLSCQKQLVFDAVLCIKTCNKGLISYTIKLVGTN